MTGTFNGLDEGAILAVAGVYFKITYQGGAGHDVVLNRFASTTTTLTLPATFSVYSQPVTFTATVVTVPSGGSPTGTVTFYDGSTNLGTGTLNGSGVASVTTTILPVGYDGITATYSGDSFDVTSNASAVTQQVFQDTTTSTVTTLVTPSVFGQSVTITATVAANAPGTGMGDGTVIFYDGAMPVASGVPLVSGQATYTSSSLTLGTHNFSVAYSGSTNYIQSYSISSLPLVQTVNQASTTTTLTSTGATVYLGSVTFTATVTATAPGAGDADRDRDLPRRHDDARHRVAHRRRDDVHHHRAEPRHALDHRFLWR